MEDDFKYKNNVRTDYLKKLKEKSQRYVVIKHDR